MEHQDPASKIISLIREATESTNPAQGAGQQLAAAHITVVVGDGNVVAPGARAAAFFSRLPSAAAPPDPAHLTSELQRLVDDWVLAHNSAGQGPTLTAPSAWAALGEALGVQPTWTVPPARYALARSWLRRQRESSAPGR